jgi:hypothetical protein
VTATQLYHPAMQGIHVIGVVIIPAQYPARITSVFLDVNSHSPPSDISSARTLASKSICKHGC